jgi:hypothetical protein
LTKWDDLSTAEKVWRVVWIALVISLVVWIIIFVMGLDTGSDSNSSGPAHAQAAVSSDATLAGSATSIDQATDSAWNNPDYPLDRYSDVASGSGGGFAPDTAEKRRRCGTASISKWHYGPVGRLFTVHSKAYFCANGRRITYISPHTYTEINTAGSIGQWHKDGGSTSKHWFPWRRGRLHSGYAYSKIIHFERHICLPVGGCVTLGASQIATHLRLHADGSYWRG